MECQVRVEQGVLEGKICSTYKETKYYSFEGIPYAKPPVGKLRFKDPQKPESWTGIRDAKKPGNKCAQLNPFGKGILEGSEDCLYLNVYTPVLPIEKIQKLPVMFFVHGGRLTIGYGDYYKPDYYIDRDVILVTINYRLNIFGFLCLNTPEVPGNAGCKDTVFALRWVNRNIHNFNGDGNNVTVFGESAGAAIVTSYLISRMTDGLFHKVICQSGSIISELCNIGEDPIELASQLASYLGHDLTDKHQLYDLFMNSSIEELVNATVSAELNRPPSIINAFLLPVLEKKFDNVEALYDEIPFVAMRENRFKKVPILATLNSDEAAPFLRKDENNQIIIEEDLQFFIPRYLFMQHNTPQSLKFVQNLREYYFNNNNDKKIQFLKLASDNYFLRDIILFVEMVAKYQKDIYLCRFSYNGNMNTKVMKSLGLKGASHGDMIQFQFYRKNKHDAASEKDLMISELLNESWCNFAKTGKPDLKNPQLDWQPYDIQRKLCLNIEDEIKVEKYPEFERMKFWFDLIKGRSKL